MNPQTHPLSCLVLIGGLAVSLGACARPAPGAGSAPRSSVGAVRVLPVPAAPASAWPLLVISKNASCGCCKAWVEHMRKAGFPVEVHDLDNLDPIKTRVGVPVGKGSCHTAEVGGYFIEGHIPAADIKRLLAEKPDAKGLVLPGMPPGSPGMEVPGQGMPYTVELVRKDGTTGAYAQHGQ